MCIYIRVYLYPHTYMYYWFCFSGGPRLNIATYFSLFEIMKYFNNTKSDIVGHAIRCTEDTSSFLW